MARRLREDEVLQNGIVIHWGQERPGPRRVLVSYPCCGRTAPRVDANLALLRKKREGRCISCSSRQGHPALVVLRTRRHREWEAEGKRRCSLCQRILDLNAHNFYHSGVAINRGWSRLCRECTAHKARQRNYGITPAQTATLLASQGGLCAICKQPCRPLAVDHDHSTGEIRGLLCLPCNRGLGDFKDDMQRLDQAIAYLKQHSG